MDRKGQFETLHSTHPCERRHEPRSKEFSSYNLRAAVDASGKVGEGVVVDVVVAEQHVAEQHVHVAEQHVAERGSLEKGAPEPYYCNPVI